MRGDRTPIAAIATSTATDAALAVIRMSGKETPKILSTCLRKNGRACDLSKIPPRQVSLFEFVDPVRGDILDTVTVILYRAPRSYTGEDAAELICHGGRGLTRQILSKLLEAGFSSAAAGDFTRRAFLNGKLDLAQAESVAAATSAAGLIAARAAARGLSGETSARIRSLAERLVELLSLLEANLDLSEEGINVVPAERIRSVLDTAASELTELIRHASRAELLSGAIRAALIGKPNVGKSTLLNRLLGTDRAIVSPLAGTTRDVVDGRTEINGFLFEFLDTAGLRPPTHAVESEGIARSHAVAESADLILLVLDAADVGDSDIAIAKTMPATTKKMIVLNKTDLSDCSTIHGLSLCPGAPIVRTVGTRIDGVVSLRDALADVGQQILGDMAAAPVWISGRQSECLRRAFVAVDRAKTAAAQEELTEEFLSADIREALDALEDFSGRKTPDDVLNRIFSNFCVGK